jgi:hypothetical protein
VETPCVLQLVRPFDPSNTDAEKNYDAVARRVNRVRARRIVVARELAEVERQFVEGDLVVRSGARRGQPLTTNGRRKRLARLLELGMEHRRLNDEEQFASADLDRMNEALERWARETYGA